LRAALLAGVLAAAGCAGGTDTAAVARLSAQPASFDFGNVLPGKTLQREIVLRNVGDGELRIEGVSTTCDCTVVGDYAKKLAPGDSTSLRVQLTTPTAAGRTEQTVSIDTNDPERPRVEVGVAATVVAPPPRRTDGASD
jgi:hypothetical protein